MAQTAKRLSTMRETRVQSLGREDPLEKEMAIHSSTIAWKIPWTEDPGRLHVVHGVAKSQTRLSNFTSRSCPDDYLKQARDPSPHLPAMLEGW